MDNHSTLASLIFNGLDGASGKYLLPQLRPGELLGLAGQTSPNRAHQSDLEKRQQQAKQTLRGVRAGVDPLDLAEAGWGVIYAEAEADKAPAIREALAELLQLRQGQAGERYREYLGPDAYRVGESKNGFLARFGVGPGPADPRRVPYYLLIAASPESIPYDFQYQLDVQYAVGRLYFDELEQYAAYARSLAQAERGAVSLPPRLALFGVQNEDDRPTALSASQLVQPLASSLAPICTKAGWALESIMAEQATKSRLSGWLGGPSSREEAPALLFAAGHGLGFSAGAPHQGQAQGALVCADWPGPLVWDGPIPAQHYFAADDLDSAANLAGRMAFLFACFGAGTPVEDEFARGIAGSRAALAERPFVASLPQRLLSLPRGGMQAVIGHVGRAWGFSFTWQSAGSQLAAFESTLERLMAGDPVGYAMEYFNERYAELATMLSSELLGLQLGKRVNELELAGLWVANNDARSYAVLGDPAARLVNFQK
jgi:hypothetical protein